MKRKLSLPIVLMLVSVFPAFSQDSEFEILAGIISSSSAGNVLQPAAAVQTMTGALDIPATGANAGVSGSPLDFVTAEPDRQDPLSALIGMVGRPQSKGAGLDVLDVISGAYGKSGFYMSGVFESMDFSNAQSQATAIAPMSGMTFYSPEWGAITSGFGYRPKFERMHKGIDVAMNVGDTVRAALPGVVEKVAYEAKGYGHYIIMRHDNGMETRYAHLSMPLANAGQRVMAGEPIALSGNTGNSTGPHLHFETRYNGEAVDPQTVFNFHANRQAAYMNSPLPSPDSEDTIATGFNGTKKSLSGKATYVVREGDTLSKIAKRANISVLKLCQLNFMMEGQTLMPGTMLKLK